LSTSHHPLLQALVWPWPPTVLPPFLAPPIVLRLQMEGTCQSRHVPRESLLHC
jgi:hypothetical protein